MEPWLTHALAALGGFALGAVAIRLLPGTASEGAKAAAAEAELAAYREKVARHFADTAERVNDLTDRYRGVFEQLQSGASELVEPETLRQLLGEQDGHTITLHRLGYQAESPAAAASEVAVESIPPEDTDSQSVEASAEDEHSPSVNESTEDKDKSG